MIWLTQEHLHPALIEATPPTGEPIDLAAAKVQLKVDHTDEDGLITGLIPVAREIIERLYSVTFLTTVFDLQLDAFPACLQLTRWPVVSVDQVSYVDTAGASQVLDASKYQVQLNTQPAQIIPAFGESWPSTRDQLAAVTVRFTAGHTTAGDLRAPWVHAIKLLVSHLYENRSAFKDSAFEMRELPFGVSQLMAPWETWL